MLDGRVGGLHFVEANGPRLEKISEIKDDDERRTAAENLMGEDDGLAKKERMGARLPHEEDMYDELAIFYPNRLSSASRAAVYDRMKVMDTKTSPTSAPATAVSVPFWGGHEGVRARRPRHGRARTARARSAQAGQDAQAQRDALREQRAASGRSTVVAPVYVVILDHDDE